MNDQQNIIHNILNGGPVKAYRRVNLENALANPNAVNGTRFLNMVDLNYGNRSRAESTGKKLRRSVS